MGFLLGAYDGYVALWADGNQEPLHIYPQSIELFPEEDQSALIRGISIDGEEDLNRILEDFLS